MNARAGHLGQVKNKLLSDLPKHEFLRLLQKLQSVRLSIGDVLYRSGQPSGYIYFPETAVASLVSVMEDGAPTEVGIVGSDGVLDVRLIVARKAPHHEAVVTVGGDALRIEAEELRIELYEGSALPHLLLRHAEWLLVSSAPVRCLQ